jgi:hypothetical protein
MKVNELDFRVTNANDLSFELLVDGSGIEGLEEADNRSIPSWEFETAELPNYFNHFKKRQEHLLGICSCGHSGCGAAGCVLKKDSSFVYFTNIFIDGLELPDDYQLVFTRENYESVMERIQQEIRRFSQNA